MTTQRTHYEGCHRQHLACARERVRWARGVLAEAEEALARLERAQAAQGPRRWTPTVIHTLDTTGGAAAAPAGAQALDTTNGPDGPEAA